VMRALALGAHLPATTSETEFWRLFAEDQPRLEGPMILAGDRSLSTCGRGGTRKQRPNWSQMAKLRYGAIASLDAYVEDEEGRFGWATPDYAGFWRAAERSCTPGALQTASSART
jgi:hypothetical protein